MKSKKNKKTKKNKFVEIARSFSYKLNVGNFESRDFFCSQKSECKKSDAETISEALHQFCKAEVIRAVNEYRTALARAKNDAMQTGEIDHKKAEDNAKQSAELESENL